MCHTLPSTSYVLTDVRVICHLATVVLLTQCRTNSCDACIVIDRFMGQTRRTNSCDACIVIDRFMGQTRAAT